jgi:mono/diheme cytochrome c family protein
VGRLFSLGLLAALVGLSASWTVLAQRQIDSIKGVDLYNAYCAGCHGATGKGDGAKAAALPAPPPDLTRIAERNGGKFNRNRVAAIIAGDARPGTLMLNPETGKPALRNGEHFDPMPLWGILFRYMWSDQPVAIRTGALAKHLESLQEK